MSGMDIGIPGVDKGIPFRSHAESQGGRATVCRS